MASGSRDEQRRHPRVLVDLPIRFSTIDPELDPWSGTPFFRSGEETLADVSRGGARVRSGEPLGPGRRLLLEIELPDGTAFEAIARVAWAQLEPRRSAEYGLGLEFLGGAPDHRVRLERFLHAHARRARAASA